MSLEYKYARWINSQIGGLLRFPKNYANAEFLLNLYKENYADCDEEVDEELFKQVFEKIIVAYSEL